MALLYLCLKMYKCNEEGVRGKGEAGQRLKETEGTHHDRLTDVSTKLNRHHSLI